MITWQLAHKIVLLCTVLTTVIQATAAHPPDPPWTNMDYRVLFVDELISQRKARVFFDTKIQNFTAFIIEQFDRHIYVIGAKNSLLILEGETLRKIRQRDMGRNQIAQIQRTCISCKLDVYISVMQRIPKFPFLILCLSYVFNHNSRFRKTDDKPMCEIVNIKRKLNDWVTTFESSGFAPYNPLSHNTFLAGTDNNLYVGAPFEHDDDFRIVRSGYPDLSGHIPTKGYLETPVGDTRYFNGRTDFVSSFQTEEAAFFLFRERSKEEEDCCQHNTRVTRLARICKNDPGGSGSKYPSSKNFITFLKASLNCPTPGPEGFRFEEARSAHWDDKSKMLYTVFSTADNAPAGSAICLYDYAAFNHAFEQPFKKGSKSNRWRRRHQNLCTETRNPEVVRRHRQKAQTRYPYNLMTSPIHPLRGHAVHVRFGERWSAISVDYPPKPPTEKRNIVVFFLATNRGSILKVSLITPKRSCSIEEYRFGDENEQVHKMEMYNGKNRIRTERTRYLLLATSKRMLKLPLHHCERFVKKDDCIQARDPYCGWDPHNEECTTFSDQTIWLQDLSVCPSKDHPSNPRWNPWSQWAACPSVTTRTRVRHKNVDSDSRRDPCACRYQRCIYPDLCAKENVGSSNVRVQISNCTRTVAQKSRWTEWSSWSPCSQTCGLGTRSRQRMCQHPKYLADCPYSQRLDTQPCRLADCGVIPVVNSGTWGPWSHWTTCSHRCGNGFRQRKRVCSTSSSIPGANYCIGDSQDWSNCTINKCQEVKKSSQWTQWLRDDGVSTRDNRYVKKRFQFVCSANVANPKQVNVVKIITQEKFCVDKVSCEHDARISIDQDGSWSRWSQWSVCSKTCGTGIQERTRACNNPYPLGNGRPCYGNDRESQLCNQTPCRPWSCWSEWSSCGTDCSQTRTRRCEVDNYELCQAPQTETRSCNKGRCQVDIYWTQWTRWSDCSEKGTQVRERQCGEKKVCFGSSREYKSCYYRVEETAGAGTGNIQIQNGRFGLVHIILSDVICFILGVVIAAFSVACYFRCRNNNRRRRAHHRSRARSNDYAMRQPSIPPSSTSTIQRPNNLRIVNDFHTDQPPYREGHSTAPLLPPRRYDLSPGSSTIATPNHHPNTRNLSPSSPPPLPPRLNSLSYRQHSRSASFSLHKEAAL